MIAILIEGRAVILQDENVLSKASLIVYPTHHAVGVPAKNSRNWRNARNKRAKSRLRQRFWLNAATRADVVGIYGWYLPAGFSKKGKARMIFRF